MKFKQFFKMYTEAQNRNPNFEKLARVLKLRRNLQSSLTPPEIIGQNAKPNSWESDKNFKERINDSRKRHRKESRELQLSLRLKSPKQVKMKIEELKKQENELWTICRPDFT
jgi:hypothetical protein